jgi:hypothetical protein
MRCGFFAFAFFFFFFSLLSSLSLSIFSGPSSAFFYFLLVQGLLSFLFFPVVLCRILFIAFTGVWEFMIRCA